MTAVKLPRILIDARPTMGGVERYTLELARLARNGQCRESIILYGREAVDRYRPVSPRRQAGNILRRVLGSGKRVLSDQLMVPLAVRRARAALVHSPNFLVPLCIRRPVVVTCHDLSLIDHFSTKRTGPMRYYERAVMRDGLRRAAHVIVPSRTVADELSRRFPFAASKVSVIYPPLPAFCLEPVPGGSGPAPAQIGETGPFFLSVGTIEPRKNLHRLLQGWRLAYDRCRIPLLLAGPYGWGERKLLEEQLAISDGLRWLGGVDDPTLAALYRRATAVVQYSMAEGFDYPVAEALCTGTPTVLSDIEVHREVTAGCSLFAPPHAPDVLADRLLEVCSWPAERRQAFAVRAGRQADMLRQSTAIDPYITLYQRVLADGY